MNPRSAISAVNKAGALLVFPIKDQREPASLWSHFFPRSKMKWEWDDDGDHRVADLWHLREKLSSSGKVVYTKWFRGRATLFSCELLPSLLRLMNSDYENEPEGLSLRASEIYRTLKDNSPLSTKQLKELSGLQGKWNESEYSRLLTELWRRFLIVGCGEIDDGAFPSLAIGATQLFFEEEWRAFLRISKEAALQTLAEKLSKNSPFYKYLIKIRDLAPEAPKSYIAI